MKIEDLVTVDPETLGGTPVFKGTRVPVQSLFWHLEKGITIEDFIDDFPSVTYEQVMQLLELTGNLFESSKFQKVYEAAA
jgi:uncharacterized protein (DUF433 family)